MDSDAIQVLIEGKRRFDEVIADVPIDRSSRVYMVRVRDGMVDDEGWITVDEARRKNALDRRKHGSTVNRYFNAKDAASAYIGDATLGGPEGDVAGPADAPGELGAPPAGEGPPELPDAAGGDPALAGGPQGGGEAPPPLDAFDPSMPPPPDLAAEEQPGTDEFPEPMPGGALDTMGDEPAPMDDLGMDDDGDPGMGDDDLDMDDPLGGMDDLLGDEEEEEPMTITVPRNIRLIPAKESMPSFENLLEDQLLEMSNDSAAQAWAEGKRFPPSRTVGEGRRAALAFTEDQAYSYALPIAELDRENKKAWVHSGRQGYGHGGAFSRTTTGHVSIVSAALRYEGYEITTEEFEHPEGEHWSKPDMGYVGGRLSRYSAVPKRGGEPSTSTQHRGQHYLPGMFGESKKGRESMSEKKTELPETTEEGIMEALMDGDLSAAEAVDMMEMCKDKEHKKDKAAADDEKKDKKKKKKGNIPPQFLKGDKDKK